MRENECRKENIDGEKKDKNNAEIMKAACTCLGVWLIGYCDPVLSWTVIMNCLLACVNVSSHTKIVIKYTCSTVIYTDLFPPFLTATLRT